MDNVNNLFIFLIFSVLECQGQMSMHCISSIPTGPITILIPPDYTVTYLSSPNYPGTYDDYLDCEWTIRLQTTQQTYILRLAILDFDIEESNGSCGHDNLGIYDAYDGHNPSTLLFESCHPPMSAVHIFCTSGTAAYVRLKTDGHSGTGNRGFNISLQAIDSLQARNLSYCPNDEASSSAQPNRITTTESDVSWSIVSTSKISKDPPSRIPLMVGMAIGIVLVVIILATAFVAWLG